MINEETKKPLEIIRIIGDIHAKFYVYEDIIKDVEASIQLGDFGLLRTWKKLKESNIDGYFHKILGGNHDHYDYIRENMPPCYLGDYGNFDLLGMKFFYVRGGDSIDKHSRIEGVSWFADEQLSYAQFDRAIEIYEKTKPEIVLTHTFPDKLLNHIFEYKFHNIPNITGNALSAMFDIHQPKLWIFGHMHPDINRVRIIKGTVFVCLSIEGYVDYDGKLTVEQNIKNIIKECESLKRD